MRNHNKQICEVWRTFQQAFAWVLSLGYRRPWFWPSIVRFAAISVTFRLRFWETQRHLTLEASAALGTGHFPPSWPGGPPSRALELEEPMHFQCEKPVHYISIHHPRTYVWVSLSMHIYIYISCVYVYIDMYLLFECLDLVEFNSNWSHGGPQRWTRRSCGLPHHWQRWPLDHHTSEIKLRRLYHELCPPPCELTAPTAVWNSSAEAAPGL